MQISIIVAVTANNAIGRGGDLLFHISDDLRYFKRVTTGHTIIMGRRTFESFPNGALPNRRNMVLSQNVDYHPDGAEVYTDLDSALAAVEGDNEVFIIGGGQVYSSAIDRTACIYLTEIDTVVDDADTYFPAIDPDRWIPHTIGEWQRDPRTGVRFRFTVLRRMPGLR